MIKATKTGNWGGVTNIISNSTGDMNQLINITAKQIGLKTESLIVKRIKSQPSIWQPLSEKYLARKRNAKPTSYSNLTLIKTGTMIGSITSSYQNMKIYAGVKKTATYADGERVANIAAVHEYGSKARNIPARQVYRPVAAQMKRLITRDDLIGLIFKKNIKRKYGI